MPIDPQPRSAEELAVAERLALRAGQLIVLDPPPPAMQPSAVGMGLVGSVHLGSAEFGSSPVIWPAFSMPVKLDAFTALSAFVAVVAVCAVVALSAVVAVSAAADRETRSVQINAPVAVVAIARPKAASHGTPV